MTFIPVRDHCEGGSTVILVPPELVLPFEPLAPVFPRFPVALLDDRIEYFIMVPRRLITRHKKAVAFNLTGSAYRVRTLPYLTYDSDKKRHLP